MAAKKHDEVRGIDLEGQDRIRELEQGGVDIPHGPHSGPLATDKESEAADSEDLRDVQRVDNGPDQVEEFGNPPDPKLKRIGSKKGFVTSSEREHDPDNESYEHTGSDNREGMGSGTEAGPAHQGHSKP